MEAQAASRGGPCLVQVALRQSQALSCPCSPTASGPPQAFYYEGKRSTYRNTKVYILLYFETRQVLQPLENALESLWPGSESVLHKQTVISKRKEMFSSPRKHKEVALGSTEPWGEDHQLGKEPGSVAAGTVLQRSCSLGHHGLSHPGHHGAPDPKAPCRVRPAFPPPTRSGL